VATEGPWYVRDGICVHRLTGAFVMPTDNYADDDAIRLERAKRLCEALNRLDAIARKALPKDEGPPP